MSDHSVITLRAENVEFVSPEFESVASWPFEDDFVSRLLATDISQRMQYSNCRLWIYRNPDNEAIGFGTLEVSDYYSEYASGLRHTYISLLALKPNVGRRGYGTSIVRRLIAVAAKVPAADTLCDTLLFLDVYSASTAAIRLYDKCGFNRLLDAPLIDAQADGKPYYIMTKSLVDPSDSASATPGM